MEIKLDHAETTDAMAFYLKEKYNLGNNGEEVSIDIVKQPKTSMITTTISLIPPSDEKKPIQPLSKLDVEESVVEEVEAVSKHKETSDAVNNIFSQTS